jgi:RNA polymerase sigma-70 factor (ECF subfamily)
MNPIGAELLSGLLDEHSGSLMLYARQWCDTPEDVVQEAFVLLARQTSVPENVVGWLYRVVRNAAISASRAAGRRARYETAAAQRHDTWFEPTAGDRLDAAAATEALRQLPIEQREAIVARLWAGLSFDEIAALMGASTSAVHRWYHAGLTALRERMGVPCLEKKTRNAN